MVYQSIEGPTDERLRHAEGFHELTGQDRASQKYSMLDAPIERMRARGAISPIEHAALCKYRHHWYHGGLLSSCGSMDLGRIFASDPLSMSGMAKSEAQYHHRQQYRQARQEIGHRPGIVVDNVVCQEWPLHTAGHAIGYDSPYRAREAASVMLRDAGYRLARLWGIG